ncbi:preprotein translocase subunit SecE [Hutsoniella sourekii]|uniref:preprotein translocase subunit SecE n=1 Tax=Hutsoniella sourekii TaxID=87650 RepID=UPI0004866E1B|nr:preprotein translocase subunit SecE [Hutsoniella sourekii]
MGYFREVGREMKKVTWPSFKETNHFTWVVLFMVLFFAIYFAGVDTLFSELIGWLISL